MLQAAKDIACGGRGCDTPTASRKRRNPGLPTPDPIETLLQEGQADESSAAAKLLQACVPACLHIDAAAHAKLAGSSTSAPAHVAAGETQAGGAAGTGDDGPALRWEPDTAARVVRTLTAMACGPHSSSVLASPALHTSVGDKVACAYDIAPMIHAPGTRAYSRAMDGATGVELAVAAGMRLLASVKPGHQSSVPYAMLCAKGVSSASREAAANAVAHREPSTQAAAVTTAMLKVCRATAIALPDGERGPLVDATVAAISTAITHPSPVVREAAYRTAHSLALVLPPLHARALCSALHARGVVASLCDDSSAVRAAAMDCVAASVLLRLSSNDACSESHQDKFEIPPLTPPQAKAASLPVGSFDSVGDEDRATALGSIRKACSAVVDASPQVRLAALRLLSNAAADLRTCGTFPCMPLLLLLLLLPYAATLEVVCKGSQRAGACADELFRMQTLSKARLRPTLGGGYRVHGDQLFQGASAFSAADKAAHAAGVSPFQAIGDGGGSPPLTQVCGRHASHVVWRASYSFQPAPSWACVHTRRCKRGVWSMAASAASSTR